LKKSGAEILIESLRHEGVDTVFGYPGGAVLNIYDTLMDYSENRHLLVRHEQGRSAWRMGTPGLQARWASAS
jgi:acetolactate synthase-1/2/3 large subunit